MTIRPQPQIPFALGPFAVVNRFGNAAEVGLTCDAYDLYDLPSPDGLGLDTLAVARWVSGPFFLEPSHEQRVAIMAWAWNGRTPPEIVNAALVEVGKAVVHYFTGVMAIPDDPPSIEHPILWPLHQRLVDEVLAFTNGVERPRGSAACLRPCSSGIPSTFREYVPSYFRLADSMPS